ncbi:MAG: type I secretion system permease/ATPase [Hyphomicrobiaceae bacterium]
MQEFVSDSARPQSELEIATDTGLVALITVLVYHDIAVSPSTIAHKYRGAGQRMDAFDIVSASRALGLKARLTKTRVDRLEKLSLPAIAMSKSGEFFLVLKVGEGKILVKRGINPPELWSLAQLEVNWSGDIILVARRENLDLQALRFGFRWFVPVIARFKALFTEVLVASFFIQLFALITPMFTQVVIDKVLVHRGLTTLDVLVVGLIAIGIFDVLLNGLRTYIFAHTTSRVDALLGSKLFEHLLNLPIAYHETRPTGQTVARVRELENVREFLTSSALTLVIDLFFTAVFFVVMWFYSPTLTLIVLGSIPFYIAIAIVITPRLRARIEERFQRGAVSQAFLVESVAGAETLKAMSVEPQMRRRWDEILAGYVQSSFKTISLGNVGSQSVELVRKITMALLLWFGASLVIAGELTIGEYIAFNMLSGHVTGPIVRLAQLWNDFQQFRISIERLGDILNTPTEYTSKSQPSLPPLTGEVRFENVTFRYQPNTPEILKDVSLHVSPGEVIGIVGRSGSGKSTLTKLLQRLHTPESGRVLLDGADVGLLEPSWLRRQIGVVLQENVLFNRAVRDNIALADPAMDMDRVIAAAELAAAHEFILELPHGYDTVLEERGSNLSGGQRQRIAIARALATEPRILVFDEATSALDYEAEAIIQDNMRHICRGRTVFLVAHRLSTVRHCDRILVMDKGRIVEEGSHEALIAYGGIYSQLARQAQS